ncbi:MAG: DEAD/DEAH box helicase, partial [Vulcanococcus sp.]
MAQPSFDLRPSGRPQPLPCTGLQPRQWQSQLIQLLRRRLERSSNADVLINAGPGAGNTPGARLSYAPRPRDGRLQRFLGYPHRSSSATQGLAAAPRLVLQ